MAGDKSRSRTESTVTKWLDDQAANRLASYPDKAGPPDYVFAFHDDEEIGPRMLARIGKHTGLRPDDL